MFDQVVGVTDDGKQYDQEDAQLQGFDQGRPRFYVMRLPARGLAFHRITYHAKVTGTREGTNPLAYRPFLELNIDPYRPLVRMKLQVKC